VLGGLAVLFLIPTLKTAVLIWQDSTDVPYFWLLLVGSGLFGFWCLVALIVWVIDRIQVAQIRAFLNSDRPLIRWQYTAREWAAVKEARWREEESDWKVQLGCLTVLFAIIGALVGGLIGLDESAEQALLLGLLGALAGAVIGALIGVAVGGGNHLTARLAWRDPAVPLVALAPHEVYANGQYFRGDGSYRYIRGAQLDTGPPAVLTLDIWSPKIRMDPEEEWEIAVPDHLVDAVDEVHPRLVPHPGDGQPAGG
jgi:hypothetical protein